MKRALECQVRVGYILLSSASLKSKVNRRIKLNSKPTSSWLALTKKNLPTWFRHPRIWSYRRQFLILYQNKDVSLLWRSGVWHVTHCEPWVSPPQWVRDTLWLCAGSRDQFQLQLTHGALCIGAMQLASRSDSTWNMQNSEMMNNFAANQENTATIWRMQPTCWIQQAMCHFFIANLMRQTDVLVDWLTVQKNIYWSSLHILHYGEIIKLSVIKLS